MKKKDLPTKVLTFLPSRKTVEYTGTPSILEVAIANDIDLGHSCGGMGSCTTCRIFVQNKLDELEPRNEIESEHAQMRGYLHAERLSCQTSAIDGMVVLIPEENLD